MNTKETPQDTIRNIVQKCYRTPCKDCDEILRLLQKKDMEITNLEQELTSKRAKISVLEDTICKREQEIAKLRHDIRVFASDMYRRMSEIHS